MNEFYQEMSETALEMLTEFGQTMLILRSGTPKSDPVKGTVTATEIQLPTTGVLLEFSSELVDGSNIRISDRQVIASNEVDIKDGDRLKDASGKVWSLMDIAATDPASTGAVIYTCKARA